MLGNVLAQHLHGLVVFTQDPRIRRKLLEEAALVEEQDCPGRQQAPF